MYHVTCPGAVLTKSNLSSARTTIRLALSCGSGGNIPGRINSQRGHSQRGHMIEVEIASAYHSLP